MKRILYSSLRNNIICGILLFLATTTQPQAQIAYPVASTYLGVGIVQYKGMAPTSNLTPAVILGGDYSINRQLKLGIQIQRGTFSGGSPSNAYGWNFNTTFYSFQISGKYYPLQFGMAVTTNPIWRALKQVFLGTMVGVIGTHVNSINREASDGSYLYGADGVLAPLVSFSAGITHDLLNREGRPWAFFKLQSQWTLAITNQLGGYANPPILSGDKKDAYWLSQFAIGYYFGGYEVYYKPTTR